MTSFAYYARPVDGRIQVRVFEGPRLEERELCGTLQFSSDGWMAFREQLSRTPDSSDTHEIKEWPG